MANHRITIGVDATGSLTFTDDAAANAKKKHVNQNDRVRWSTALGNLAVLFKGGKSPTPEGAYAAEAGADTDDPKIDKAKVPGLPGETPEQIEKKNTYTYFVAIAKADGTVISQDPDIIVDN